MGFAFPKEEREALVASEPEKFLMPRMSDLRYNWVVVRLDKLDLDEMHELVLDAWRMCVPKKVSSSYDLVAAAAPARKSSTARASATRAPTTSSASSPNGSSVTRLSR